MSHHPVNLGPERFAQLKNLAAIEGRSLAETVASFLDEAIASNRLPDELPGWHVQRLGDRVVFAHGASGLVKSMTLPEATAFADTLTRFGQPGVRRSAVLDLDIMLEIRRRGAGVLLRDAAESFAETTVSGNVAADLGRRITQAAA